ncbi:hypothetical protein VFPPC_09916 [Pochonia chlamydosporia 170]|uniref:Uncharacterized protein n=1 Tax=Pochonia chlamydosporia 170 TaxID=1380566 RepID=A0A179F2Y5_METCM|nr:hypothetical protein VFPPC_09916 [Pochonia chlamydosporia 170]OAQ59802.1 hypothetical protein VFPPC_09916 [Pochonia chlamydosporia 170]
MAPKTYTPTFFLLKNRMPASESADLLGRVVRRYQDPVFDYTPESPESTLTSDVFARFRLSPQYDDDARYTGQAALSSNALFQLLTRLSASNTTSNTTAVVSPRIVTRRLKLESEYFAALKANPAIRRKLLEMCPVNDKVYLIVGTMSVQEASFERSTLMGRSTNTGITLPLGLAASAASIATGVPLPGVADAIPDAEAGFERGSVVSSTASFTTSVKEGEEVIAIACRTVTRTWRGFGKDVQMGTRQPEYRGGQHFGEGSGSDSEFEDEDEGGSGRSEEVEAALAMGLELGDEVSGSFEADGQRWLRPLLC